MLRIFAAVAVVTTVQIVSATELEDVWAKPKQIKVKNPAYTKNQPKRSPTFTPEPKLIALDVDLGAPRFAAAECVTTSGYDYVGGNLLQPHAENKARPSVEENDFKVLQLFHAGHNYCRYRCQETDGCMFFTVAAGRCYLKGASAVKKKVRNDNKMGGACVPTVPDKVQVAVASPMVGKVVKANSDYTAAANSDKLSFKRGAEFRVLAEDGDAFYIVETVGGTAANPLIRAPPTGTIARVRVTEDPCNLISCAKQCKGRQFLNKVGYKCGWNSTDTSTGSEGTCVLGVKTKRSEKSLGECPSAWLSTTTATRTTTTATTVVKCQNRACKRLFKKMPWADVCDIDMCSPCAKCRKLVPAVPTPAPTPPPTFEKKCVRVKHKDWISGVISEGKTGSYSKCESNCIKSKACIHFVFMEGGCKLIREVVDKKGNVIQSEKKKKNHVGGTCARVVKVD